MQEDSTAKDWMKVKDAGNTQFKKKCYKQAYKLYEEALSIIETENNNNNNDLIGPRLTKVEDVSADIAIDLAKLYSNLSVSMYQMATSELDQDIKRQKLEKALAHGQNAVKWDENLDKAHFRCAICLNALSRKDEMVSFGETIINLYTKSGRDYTEDSHVMQILRDCDYFSRDITSTQFWEQVTWKDSYCVIGKNSQNKTLVPHLVKGKKNLSIILQPGTYRITKCIEIQAGQTIQVIGDLRRETDKVVLECTGAVYECNLICNMFTVKGGKLSMRNVSLRQASGHPDLHAVYCADGGVLNLEKCKCYSQVSACIGGNIGSTLNISDCIFEKACGGVIVVAKSTANVTRTKFSRIARIGLEARDGAWMRIEDCEISECGSQAISCHAYAKGVHVEGCKLTNNARDMRGRSPAITCASGNSNVVDCTLTSNEGGGVMIQEGAKVDITGNTIRNGRYGIGASCKGEGNITNNTILGTQFGVCVVHNQGGQIVLKNNTIKSISNEVMVSPADVPPTIRGDDGPSVTTHTMSEESQREGLLRAQATQNRDHYRNTHPLMDPRLFETTEERHCRPCGLSQRAHGDRFMMCKGCKMEWYCSPKCQKKDWKLHRANCKHMQEVLKEK